MSQYDHDQLHTKPYVKSEHNLRSEHTALKKDSAGCPALTSQIKYSVCRQTSVGTFSLLFSLFRWRNWTCLGLVRNRVGKCSFSLSPGSGSSTRQVLNRGDGLRCIRLPTGTTTPPCNSSPSGGQRGLFDPHRELAGLAILE